jgi:hypothetical protein
MLHRETADGPIVIAQPAHAWVSGQLARAWGNALVGPLMPREAVCLAAAQHDIGWTDWELAPTLNPTTGRPHTFMELPLADHLAIWSGAGRLALTQGRYPAVLVSMHFTSLYAQRDPARDTAEERVTIQAALDRERAFQENLLATLRAEPVTAALAEPATLARNQRLIAVWDWLSLLLCMGLPGERVVADVPAAGGAIALTLTPIDGDATRVRVNPWPFAASSVTLTVDGRRLPDRFEDVAALRAALVRAPWVTIEMQLVTG